jgi:hypothetical protein
MSGVISVVYHYSVFRQFVALCTVHCFRHDICFLPYILVYKVTCSVWNAKWWPLARNMVVLKKWKVLLWLQVAELTVIIKGFLHLALEGYHHCSRLPAPGRVLVAALLSHGSDFLYPPPPKKRGGCVEHAYFVSSKNTVKKNWVKGLNYSQSPSHTVYTLYGSNLVLLLDDEGTIFIRDGGIFLLSLRPLNLWG